MERIKTIIGVEGGLIQGISSTDGIDVVVFDYDTQGVDSNDLFENSEGSVCFAYNPGISIDHEFVYNNYCLLHEKNKGGKS